MSKVETFKIQRPIVAKGVDAGGTEILVYNKDRSIMFTWEMDFWDNSHGTALRKLFGNEYKIYVEGYVDNDGKFRIGKVLKHHIGW